MTDSILRIKLRGPNFSGPTFELEAPAALVSTYLDTMNSTPAPGSPTELNVRLGVALVALLERTFQDKTLEEVLVAVGAVIETTNAGTDTNSEDDTDSDTNTDTEADSDTDTNADAKPDITIGGRQD